MSEAERSIQKTRRINTGNNENEKPKNYQNMFALLPILVYAKWFASEQYVDRILVLDYKTSSAQL